MLNKLVDSMLTEYRISQVMWPRIGMLLVLFSDRCIEH